MADSGLEQKQRQPTVGASLLAKIANDDAGNQAKRGGLRFFASKLAPTQIQPPHHDAQRVALDLDLESPRQPRWPNAGLNPWVTRQDAGLAALRHGWRMAAAHGFKPE